MCAFMHVCMNLGTKRPCMGKTQQWEKMKEPRGPAAERTPCPSRWSLPASAEDGALFPTAALILHDKMCLHLCSTCMKWCDRNPRCRVGPQWGSMPPRDNCCWKHMDSRGSQGPCGWKSGPMTCFLNCYLRHLQLAQSGHQCFPGSPWHKRILQGPGMTS